MKTKRHGEEEWERHGDMPDGVPGQLMMMKTKKQREEDWDRLSDLPDDILLHIVKLLSTKQAVQTGFLSKRWKDIWKCGLTNLKFSWADFWDVANFNKCVSLVLSSQNCSSSSLHSLELSFCCFIRSKPVDRELQSRVIRYAVLHSVQHVTIDIELTFSLTPEFQLPPIMFSCPSLTFLNICIDNKQKIKLPKSFHLPALRSLYLAYVTFTASDDNDCVEPFSTCNMLNTLVIQFCYLDFYAHVLHISNSNLSSLTIRHCHAYYKIALSTPNLTSLTIRGTPILQLSFKCNLSFLDEVYIDASARFERVLDIDTRRKRDLVIINLLQVLANDSVVRPMN
ncbi:putative F-box/LRR-repeat protein At4g15060 [Gastrolobium bilobum]|uniref:putative F-box/LRR-repeat protein At4g15060 n=1 Tax=Gastrolobium bilobum TaxID=150636 RepID=UPI002AB1BACF|nr:putative F-box/LRR-repeat protein At4g15060 [Gastrolobium bilobum]